EELALPFVERSGYAKVHEVRVAEYRVDGCADLVAHGGQEVRLRLVRGLRPRPMLLRLTLRTLCEGEQPLTLDGRLVSLGGGCEVHGEAHSPGIGAYLEPGARGLVPLLERHRLAGFHCAVEHALERGTASGLELLPGQPPQ